VEFVRKEDGEAVAGEGPQFFDQPVIEVAIPFPRKESLYRFAAAKEFSPAEELSDV
jgi:hypothetical protein